VKAIILGTEFDAMLGLKRRCHTWNILQIRAR
jgi:hypothetical protein